MPIDSVAEIFQRHMTTLVREAAARRRGPRATELAGPVRLPPSLRRAA